MFTDNYIKYKKMMFFGSHDGLSYVLDNGSGMNANYGNSNYNSDIGKYMHNGYCGDPNYQRPGVYFGSGSTPAARTDYCLESVITSGLTITGPAKAAIGAEGEGKYIVQSPFTVYNTSDADINIYEVGYYSLVNNAYIALFDRTVLDEPIVIPAGQSKLVTYKLVFNQS